MLQTNKTMNGLLEENRDKHVLKRTKAELEEAITRIRSLEGQLVSLRKDRFGKRMIGKDYAVDSKDYLVMDHVAKYIHKDLWRFHKFLPDA